MFPMGHVGFSVFLGDSFDLNLLAVSIGAILPDLIDKPTVIISKSGPGRFIGHTLLATFLLGFILIVLKKRDWGISMSFGMLLHLIEDSNVFVPWFFPFIKYNIPLNVHFNIWELYFTPYNLAADFIGLLFISYLVSKYWSGITSSPLYKRTTNLQIFETLDSIFYPLSRKK